ncbi:unnamed protein product [Acanthosepion pharaonis]|uniref:Uncharacterized protein n=1 Tax=Acanthosepion pharaonis TaxID=158019 RepID=A0A812BAR4_ACAPH|nr:unnamed protein product [Sepia pharaonis]
MLWLMVSSPLLWVPSLSFYSFLLFIPLFQSPPLSSYIFSPLSLHLCPSTSSIFLSTSISLIYLSFSTPSPLYPHPSLHLYLSPPLSLSTSISLHLYLSPPLSLSTSISLHLYLSPPLSPHPFYIPLSLSSLSTYLPPLSTSISLSLSISSLFLPPSISLFHPPCSSSFSLSPSIPHCSAVELVIFRHNNSIFFFIVCDDVKMFRLQEDILTCFVQ